MDVAGLLLELYGRIPPLAERAVDGLDTDALCEAPVEGANSIGWLIWHVARVQDHQLAEVFGGDQVWTTGDWAPRFELEPDPANMGYGHDEADLATVRPDGPDALNGYLAAVDAQTIDLLSEVSEADLDQIVDERWDPPVTLAVRLVSVADDCLQHVGQANYLRGVYDRTPN